MLALVLEAALRSMLMAGVVWGCIRLLRMRALPAQKVAWVLVLVAAGTMPFVMRAPFVASLLANRGVQIPLHSLPKWLGRDAAAQAKAPVVASAAKIQIQTVKIPKPSAAHVERLDEDRLGNENTDALVLTNTSDSADENTLAVERAAVAQIAQVTQPATAVSAASSFVAHKAEPFWNWDRVRNVAFAAYFTGMGLLLLRMTIGLGLAYRLWRRATPVSGLETFIDSTQRTLRVRVSPDLVTPVTIASTVLLPADYAEWDKAKLRIVLAHEQSHVKQGDFYLQLVAAVHAAIFWFSPLGWWLQRKLSELGEALSDRAGMEHSESPAFYAQILLEFAAKPRKTSFFAPVAGVAMARNSNLSNLSVRIERILNARGFGISSLGGRRHAVLAAAVVPVALLAAVALVRVAPAVQAAQSVRSADRATGKGSSQANGQATGTATGGQVTSVDIAQSVPPPPPAPDVEPPSPPDVAPPVVEPVPAVEALEAPEPPLVYSEDDAVAIVQGAGNTIMMNGHDGMDLKKAKEKYHGNFIWFERDGKPYVITDPQIVANAKEMFKEDPALRQRQIALQDRMEQLQMTMKNSAVEQATVKLDSPEFKAQMEKLSAEIAQLQTMKIKELTDKITQEKIAEIQERVGQIQERLGDIQGRIGEKQGEIGARQGEMGERMGKLGEEMGKIGEEQGRRAEEAAKKLKSVIDQAVKDGKAKPVE